MKIQLVYPCIIGDRPPKARATCECRLTAKQIVVTSGRVTEGKVLLGGMPYRYWRANGNILGGHLWGLGWRLAAGELARIEAQAKAGTP